MVRIYLDVCCLNRPFDDQNQDRIHLESEAVRIILKHVKIREYEWIGSSVVEYEIQRTPDLDRRNKVLLLTQAVNKTVKLDETDRTRVTELSSLGFKAFDALHVVCAEKAQVDVLLTTDDKFLKKGIQNSDMLTVRIMNPVSWLQEVMR
jgi:predicted nucleic acid-binding protein